MNDDILVSICVRLDWTTINAFRRYSRQARRIARTQHLWCLRTKHLTGKELRYREPSGLGWGGIYVVILGAMLGNRSPYDMLIATDAFAMSVLLEAEYDPTAEGMKTRLFDVACRDGHIDVVKALLADGHMDPGTDNSSALRWAHERGQTELVRLLLEDGRVDRSAIGL